MGLFSSSKAPPKPSKQPDVVRMMTGRATYEEAAIEHVLREQQAQQLNALEQERKAVNAVADRERQIMGKLAQVKAQLTETADELERSRKAEADLHKALRLAAERLAAATSHEDGLRAELEDSKASLVDARRQIQHLEARLYGEKGIKLGALQGANHGGPPPAHLQPPRAPAKDEEVITSLVTGAVPAAKDAASIGEERATATRQAREQLKRLLQFVTKQLSDDLGKWRGFGDAPPPELTNSIGNQRALLSKLESALHELMDPLERSRSAQQARAAPFGAGDGVGFSVRVHGDMLPRSVAVNDSTIRPILLASGPAVRWVLRQHDAPPDTPNTQALKAKRRAAVAAGAEVEEEQIDWVAGETLMMVIEAVDDSGTVDVDFDAVVLLDCEAHVEGRGLVKVAKGRGFVPLVTTKSGEVTLELRDGGFTTMEPPPPIRVDFKGGPPAMIVFTPERQEEMAGEGIGVSVEARDRFDNVSTDVEGLEVQLAATHGATWGDEPVKLEAGVAQIDLVSEQAGTITLSCVGVTGDKAEMFPEHGLSNVAHLRYTPGNAACVQLSLLPDSFGAERIAGQRTKLLVTVADKNGNPVESSNLAADLKVVAGPIGNASVERGGSCSIADGVGEVWVYSETAKEPTQFWITSSAAGGMVGGLVIRHTEDEPFEAMWTAGGIAQFGLYLPSDQPVHVGGEEKMIVGVRTEDAFGNPRSGFDGRVLVVSHSRHVHFTQGHGKVQIADGEGRLEIESNVTEPFQLSLQDISRHGLRTASVLRTAFTAQAGVRAVFGDVGGATQKVGFPYPLPLLVLDRFGNVATEYEGEIPVAMSGAARVAGRAPEIFRVVGGRATLPVLTTIAESCTFRLSEETAIIDPDVVASSPALHSYADETTVHFIAADVSSLVLSVAVADPDSLAHDVALAGKHPPPSPPGGGAGAIPLATGAGAPAPAGDRGGGRADAPATDGEIATAAQDDLSGRPRTPTTVTAGHDVLVSVKGLDAYMNLVPHQEVTVFLEAELKPVYDDSLTNANLSQQAKEPPQRYLLTLSNGEAFQRVPTRVAGELTLRLVQASSPNIDITASRRLKVHAASAVSIDVVNMPEAGRAGVEFQLMVRALDQFGNVDDSFEREVSLDSDGAPPGMELQNGGVVRLARGIGRCACLMQGATATGGAPAVPAL